ncbi:hypothetical protein BDV29DRAFT_195605 [Aspergillus leporis]|uniref:Uncharacterized protein n=1 Tax=Aspergillus leporis TaxID=41062 RepID=A0A5N5WJN5_9EURO|nr:hypothetical protein BDV29DRAFT_195605 [Aspergillus leporis]
MSYHKFHIHGTATRVEGDNTNIQLRGWGAVLSPKVNHYLQDQWVHLAIPTPQYIRLKQQRCYTAGFWFSAGSLGRIDSVHVYHGQSKILNRDYLWMHGAHTETEETFSLGELVLDKAIGISLKIAFQEGDSTERWITISSGFVGTLDVSPPSGVVAAEDVPPHEVLYLE